MKKRPTRAIKDETEAEEKRLSCIPEHCKEALRVPRIKVEEKGKKATFVNDDGHLYYRIKFDGCVVNQMTAADRVVTKVGVGDIIVELKGKNVNHAVKQACQTAEYWVRNGL